MDEVERLLKKLFEEEGEVQVFQELRQAEVQEVQSIKKFRRNNNKNINSVKAWVNEHGNVIIQGYYMNKLVNVMIPLNDIDNYIFYVHGHAERLLKKHGHKLLKLKDKVQEVIIYP